jgi:pseudo-rSAM protein
MWIILESYVYVHKTACEAILYNTLNYESYCTGNEYELCLIEQLLENDYSIHLNDEVVRLDDIRNLKKWLRETFSGDCIDDRIIKCKPIVIKPQLYIKHNLLDLRNDELLWGKNLNQSLNELMIYVNGSCKNNCKRCKSMYKQFFFCKKEETKELDIEYIDSLLKQLKGTSLNKIYIAGGNVLEYTYLNELLELLSKYDYHFVFCLNIHHLSDISMLEYFHANQIQVNLWVPLDSLNDKTTQTISQMRSNYSDIISVFYIIEKVSEFSLLENSGIYDDTNKIIPFYNGHNASFFESKVYLTKEDVLGTQCSMDNILSKGVFNLNYFGKLIVDCDKKVYTSMNLDCLGEITSPESFWSVLINAVKPSSGWRMLRKDVEGCKNCLFNFLCPPISDYEMVMHTNQLCFNGKERIK